MAFPRYARGSPVVDILSDLGKFVKNKGKSQKYSIATRAPIYTVVPMYPSVYPFVRNSDASVIVIVSWNPLRKPCQGACSRTLLTRAFNYAALHSLPPADPHMPPNYSLRRIYALQPFKEHYGPDEKHILKRRREEAAQDETGGGGGL
jgi:hypothetical protein